MDHFCSQVYVTIVSEYCLSFTFSESDSEDEDTGKPMTTDELRTRALKGVCQLCMFFCFLPLSTVCFHIPMSSSQLGDP